MVFDEFITEFKGFCRCKTVGDDSEDGGGVKSVDPSPVYFVFLSLVLI